ncbi:MAG: PKD domain-containing protein, partial [Candidatus Thermoplasmatota archaeon]|nr:PKD domain-containing protein [Candidatus Thermoplasmatota archaeon]
METGHAGLLAAVLLIAGLAGCIGDTEPVDLNNLQGLQVSVTPESGDEDTEFTFDASQTPGADQLSFAWDFGDGANATGAVVTHTFAYTNNLYEVRVTATHGNETLT